MLIACEVFGNVLDGVEEALEHPDLPRSLCDELAETTSTRKVNIEVSEPSASIELD